MTDWKKKCDTLYNFYSMFLCYEWSCLDQRVGTDTWQSQQERNFPSCYPGCES